VIFVDRYRPVAPATYLKLLINRGKSCRVHAWTGGNERAPVFVLWEGLDSFHCSSMPNRLDTLFTTGVARCREGEEREGKEGGTRAHAA
jgi:hypothetical protein